MKKTKRLDGKSILVTLTARLESDMNIYCRDKGIESQSELVRQAISKYIYADYSDETLKLQGIKQLQSNTKELQDMFECFFKYIRLMHINWLAYMPEIAPEFADAALKSARIRHDKVFDSFQESLKNDPPFFERLLHIYYPGD